MLAYGKIFQREGIRSGLSRVAQRIGRLYLFQIGLLLTTLIVALIWTTHYNMQPTIMRAIREAPVVGLTHALTLRAVPAYLDILPLYIVLLASFPLLYAGLRKSPWLTLGGSAAIWLAANVCESLNLPNWMDGHGWFFNPFAWQFLFAIGAMLALQCAAHGGGLPRVRWLAWVCGAYLLFAFFESAPWSAWMLPNLEPIGLPSPDKTNLGILRILDILAIAYLMLSSTWLRELAGRGVMRMLALCGRHSLEVFTAGCVSALFGRLLFTTHGSGVELQSAVNVCGVAAMFLVGWWLDRSRRRCIAGADEPVSTLTDSQPALVS
jgi:hypothetical protein